MVSILLIVNLHLLLLFYQLYFLVFGRSIANLFCRLENSFGHCSSNLQRWIPFIAIIGILVHLPPEILHGVPYEIESLPGVKIYHEVVMGFNSASTTALILAFCLKLA